jgi:hypothetical protein
MWGANRVFCWLVVLICGAPFLCGQAERTPLPLPESEVTETYSVYSALIRRHLDARHPDKVLILASTRSHPDAAACLKAPEGKDATLYREQITSYLDRNKSEWELLPKFDIGRPYEVVKSVPVSGPRRLSLSVRHFALSAIGFNSAGDRAAVYMEHGGIGRVHFLTKAGHEWTVDFERMPGVCAWIA